jgi:hypothetical protein
MSLGPVGGLVVGAEEAEPFAPPSAARLFVSLQLRQSNLLLK